MGLQIFLGDLELQTVHRGIGLDRGRIYRLGMPAHHTFLNAHGQYPCEHFLENSLREQLARAAYRRMPRQFLINIIAQKIKDIQTHAAMDDQIPVTDDVLQIAHQAQLEEDHRVDALLAASAIVDLGQWIQEIQIQYPFQPSIKIVPWDTVAQLKVGEQFFLILFLSLHT